jgi:hypothetical protein
MDEEQRREGGGVLLDTKANRFSVEDRILFTTGVINEHVFALLDLGENQNKMFKGKQTSGIKRMKNWYKSK